ncbi:MULTISPECIES: hypothetical protein [Pseudomonas]|uniref:hypothetical protein n=1 Tax=Pseudomonas TaxID=286 RepID=UPI00111BD2DC|nr:MULTISPECIES: hypothetical protein [Pseudomonas]MCX4219265.1 hypothetical protein [Pseudomonas sp. MCal1]UDI92542.1 hypothetical protein I5961_26135 [Pseudomonas sp. IAC-BECa141]UIN56078.1 hypothetical protein LXN51_07045 [Pseudomonas kribbensis]
MTIFHSQGEGLQYKIGDTINFTHDGSALFDMRIIGIDQTATSLIAAPNSAPSKLKPYLFRNTTLLTKISFKEPPKNQLSVGTQTLTAYPRNGNGAVSGGLIAFWGTPGAGSTNWDDGEPPLVPRPEHAWNVPDYPGQQTSWHSNLCVCWRCQAIYAAATASLGHPATPWGDYRYGDPVKP